ncbi:MAG: hypothetical protein R2867_13090 [Caldilineaceae bacterium]
MKIESLYVAEYRILKDLRIDFSRGGNSALDPQRGYTLDFLVGVNGTGKTTVLQFLGRLLVALYEQDTFPIPFRLVYTLTSAEVGDERRITVTNIPEESVDIPSNEVNAGAERFYYREEGGTEQRGRLPNTLLPELVVVYTTGSEREWLAALQSPSAPSEEAAPDQMQLEAPVEQPGHRPNFAIFHEEDPPSPQNVLFIQAAHSSLVALCGLLAAEQYYQIQLREEASAQSVLRSVLDALRLEPLGGFSLRIRAHQNLTPPYQREILEALGDCADKTLTQGADQLLIFDMTKQIEKFQNGVEQKSLLQLYNSPTTLFRNLYRLYEHRPFYDPPLQEVNLFFKRTVGKHNAATTDEAATDEAATMLQLFDWLSDGERSFLARMALFALFRADDLLILLDEPEVHFNDVWKREIVHTLDQIMQDHASHALITTHSSITLTDVPSKDVIVLQRVDGATTGADVVSERKFQTFGADPSDIMVHVFGTQSASGEHSRRFIRREIGNRNTVNELDELAAIVAPGYWRYRIQLEKTRVEQVH